MMSKNTELKLLKRNVKTLNLDLKALMQEHDHYALEGSDEDAKEWFHSLPIETLYDSISKDLFLPRRKYSLKDMKMKFYLKKEYEKTQEELERKKIQLNIAVIDDLLNQIKNIPGVFNI